MADFILSLGLLIGGVLLGAILATHGITHAQLIRSVEIGAAQYDAKTGDLIWLDNRFRYVVMSTDKSTTSATTERCE